MKSLKAIFTLFFLLHIYTNSKAQYKWHIDFLNITHELTMDTIAPSFSGGDVELFKRLQKAVSYPQTALENDISGKVVIQFLVNTDSTISDIKTLRDIGGNFCSNEVIRALKKTTKWIPAQKNGKPTTSIYVLMAVFKFEYIPIQNKKKIEEPEIKE